MPGTVLRSFLAHTEGTPPQVVFRVELVSVVIIVGVGEQVHSRPGVVQHVPEIWFRRWGSGAGYKPVTESEWEQSLLPFILWYCSVKLSQWANLRIALSLNRWMTLDFLSELQKWFYLVITHKDALTSFLIYLQLVGGHLAICILHEHRQDEGDDGHLVAHDLARPPGPPCVENGHPHWKLYKSVYYWKVPRLRCFKAGYM